MKRRILLTPGSVTTSASVKQSLAVEDTCVTEKGFETLVNDVKSDLVSIVHGDRLYSAVLLGASVEGAIEATVISAMAAGGKLLIITNGGDAVMIEKIAYVNDIEFRLYQVSERQYPDLKALEEILKKDKKITHLAVVHHETATGMLNPVKEVCTLAQQYDVEVIVDASGSFAGEPINIKEWGAAYLVASSGQCLQGVSGISFVIFKNGLLKSPSNKACYFDIHLKYNHFELGKMPHYRLPVQLVYALKQAIDEYKKETEAGRKARYTQNWETLVFGLQELGFRFLLPYEQQSKILLSAFCPKHLEYDCKEMHAFLYERGFVLLPQKCENNGGFRIAVHGDLYPEDIKNFLYALRTFFEGTGQIG